jgi:hypothetical protein
MGINYQKMGLASPITDVNMGGPYTCNVVVWPLDPQRAEHIGHNSIAVIKALMNYNRARAKTLHKRTKQNHCHLFKPSISSWLPPVAPKSMPRH